jgi:hypothetical protein
MHCHLKAFVRVGGTGEGGGGGGGVARNKHVLFRGLREMSRGTTAHDLERYRELPMTVGVGQNLNYIAESQL